MLPSDILVKWVNKVPFCLSQFGKVFSALVFYLIQCYSPLCLSICTYWNLCVQSCLLISKSPSGLSLVFPFSLFITPLFSSGMESVLVCSGHCNNNTGMVVTPLWEADQQLMSLSHCPGGCKSKVKAPAHSGSAERSLPGSQTVTPPCPHTAEGREEFYTWGLFYKSINPSVGAPPSWPNHSQRPYYPRPSHWGLGFNTGILGLVGDTDPQPAAQPRVDSEAGECGMLRDSTDLHGGLRSAKEDPWVLGWDTRFSLSGTVELFKVTEERIRRFNQKRKTNRNVNRNT